MKTCPFCKNFIKDDQDICHHCSRVLVERITPKILNEAKTENRLNKASFEEEIKKIFSKINKKVLVFDKVFKKNFLIIVIIIFAIFILIYSDNNEPTYNVTPVSVLPVDESLSTKTSNIKSSSTSKTYISLANGKVLSKKSTYFNGRGELKIDNGTSLDAIAKLVNIKTNKSVITVYVKANNVYNISKITDGDYKLFFNLGNDWNDEIKAFSVNSSYEVFEEKFDYVTTESEYSTFSVTLNPVINGNAETNNVTPNEFGGY